ncbi:MAG: pantetheine-phosphate adenylyltransferase [Muribaculaceae bacterium]|nr:pantetheine-phosphate adenylyltransferase [Muribaculaceae bacterium]
MTPRFKTALFAGTFNPFTIGHKSIADRVLQIADRLVIGFGVNPDKPDPGAVSRLAGVKRLYADDPRVTVVQYSGLTTDFARECGADFMIRGVRSVADFEYERNLADINLKISGIETLLLPALPELSYVSSSMVRELAANGVDISPYVPQKNQSPA